MVIVAIAERGHGGAHLFDIAEDAAMNGLLLQRPIEALGDAVGLRFGNEGEARRDAPELDLRRPRFFWTRIWGKTVSRERGWKC